MERGVLLGLTAEARIVDVLRERILSGELVAGDRLRQVDVSDELGVSTTPVREAFRSLAAEGLLRIDSHRGVVVRTLSTVEQVEIMELHLVVERDNLARAVPRMTPADLGAAERAQEEMRRDHSAARWAMLNRDFHLALAAASGRPRTVRLLTELFNLSAIGIRDEIRRGGGRREQALVDHDDLLAAVRAGDVATAQCVLDRHVSTAIERLCEEGVGSH